MPPLTPATLTLLATTTTLTTTGRDHAATTLPHPGNAGITHHGTITTLLPSQLALPDTLFTLRLTRGELLHRLHTTTPTPPHPHTPTPPPHPVTIILDTTPPTYGPAETVLRLTAHLLTTTLWHAGRHPTLITLDRPTLAIPATGPTALTTIWTARTLHPPDLHTALRCAAHTPHPTLVILTHHHLTHDQPLTPGAHLRLLTTHTPGDPPPNHNITNSTTAERYHHHLPPQPSAAALAGTIHALLAPATNNRNPTLRPRRR